jgi:hypothetical protein
LFPLFPALPPDADVSRCDRRRLLELAGLNAVAAAEDSEAAKAIESRLGSDTRYLASDELEGRGVGTTGLDKAAQYIAEEFKKAGLKTEIFEGQPFQKFTVPSSVHRGGSAERNSLVLIPLSARMENRHRP